MPRPGTCGNCGRPYKWLAAGQRCQPCRKHFERQGVERDPLLPVRWVPRYTTEEIEIVRRWYTEHAGRPLDVQGLAALVGNREAGNVCRKARELGLTNPRRTYGGGGSRGGRTHRPLAEYLKVRATEVSGKTRAWIAQHGHPRGALGMKHSVESKRIMSEKKRTLYALTPDSVLRERGARSAKTRVARHGNLAPHMRGERAYSMAHGGGRADLGGAYFRSRWEANYARYLQWLQSRGKIKGWTYEADTFVFHGVVRNPLSYTPDFRVVALDGSVAYDEVKGWMDPKSRNKLRRMKKFYPKIRINVVGPKEYRAIQRAVSWLPGWETS